MQIRSWSWCLSVLVALTACGSKQSTPPPATTAPPQPTAERSEGGGMCPMMPGPGTTMTTSDTANGVAITFMTTGDESDLRAHVRRMADMHNSMAGMHHGESAQGGMGSADAHAGMMGMQMVPSHATVEDIPGGARLVLVPSDPAQLSALRTQAREHVAMMQRGECPMMQGSQPAQPTDEHAAPHQSGK